MIEQRPILQYQLLNYGSGDSDSDSESTYLKKTHSVISIKSIREEYDCSNPFLDENVLEYYTQVYEDSNYECRHVFDPHLTWSKTEEEKVVKKLDYRIAFFACILFVGLEIDRSNLQQAISDDFLNDLQLTTNDYNMGCTIFLSFFLLGEIPSSILLKKFGVDRFIPFQMISWSIVASLQCLLTGKKSFFITRGLCAFLQSGLIPELVTSMATYYKSNELPLRLSWFWTTLSCVKIGSSILSILILKLRGLLGWEGWRYLFLIEGLITLSIGLLSIRMLIPSPCESNGWFDNREVAIIVNRVLRDDPTKGDMNHRQGMSVRQVIGAVLDYDLWPIYIIGITSYIPIDTVYNYTTITLKSFGWSSFQINLMSIPHNVLHVVLLIQITRLSELWNQRALTCLIYPLWMIPLLGFLRYWHGAMVNQWGTWILCTLIVGAPYIHAICVSWVSRNSGSIKTRAIAAALYNISTQLGNIIGSNLYREDDAPLYKRGNSILFKISLALVPLYLLVKLYYTWRDTSKERKWDAMTVEEQNLYLQTTTDVGNKRLDFRFGS